MDPRPYKRRHYFVEPKFQLKFVGMILAVAFISAVVAGYTVYYNSWLFLGEKLANVYPQGRLMEIFKSVNVKLAINLIFVCMLCASVGILASHKIAGPVHRMIRFMNNAAKGDYSQRLRLRKGDELVDLAEAINRLVDKLDKEKRTA